MFAEVTIPLRTIAVSGLADILPTQVAHAITADTCKFVTATALHERCSASRTDTLDGIRSRGLDGLSQRHE